HAGAFVTIVTPIPGAPGEILHPVRTDVLGEGTTGPGRLVGRRVADLGPGRVDVVPHHVSATIGSPCGLLPLDLPREPPRQPGATGVPHRIIACGEQADAGHADLRRPGTPVR